jgi:glycosyltransferase involved in cell wall biosynthesis
LRAFASVIESKPTARLILIGDGPDANALKDLSAELGISDSVIFYGSSTEVPALMSAMDLFVFPSICEGLGIVAIEAQASGLPILCSSAIPRDVAVTELARFAELDLGAAHWAKEICDMINSLPERRSRAEDVKLAGFDTADSPKAVIKHYEKCRMARSKNEGL